MDPELAVDVPVDEQSLLKGFSFIGQARASAESVSPTEADIRGSRFRMTLVTITVSLACIFIALYAPGFFTAKSKSNQDSQ